MGTVSCEEKPSFHICQPTVKGGQDQLQLSLQQQIWSSVEGHTRPQLTPAEAQPSQNIPRPMALPIPNHTQHNTTQQSQRPHQQPSQNTPDYDDQWHCLSQHHNSTTQHRSKEHNTIITVAQQTTNNYPKTPPDSDAHLMGLATPRCSPNKSHPLNSL